MLTLVNVSVNCILDSHQLSVGPWDRVVVELGTVPHFAEETEGPGGEVAFARPLSCLPAEVGGCSSSDGPQGLSHRVSPSQRQEGDSDGLGGVMFSILITVSKCLHRETLDNCLF